jgi:osmotically-inducible protein OsmY
MCQLPAGFSAITALGLGGNARRSDNGQGIYGWGATMSRLSRVMGLGCVLALPVALGGCPAVLIGGGLAAAGGAGYSAAQERGVATSASDFALKTDIEADFLRSGTDLQSGATVTVYDGRVLLTGRLPAPEMKARAQQIASQRAGVRALYNEIEVGPSETTWDDTQDAWLTARVRSELVLDSDIRSGNYTIDTSGGSVYLIGSARSQAELDRATQIARYVPGVRRVVSYVEIRSGVPVAARPAPPPVSGGSQAPSAAPRTPIEVQRL